MAVDLNNVNYILLKADGSVLAQKMDYYIQQGSIGDKIFFGGVAAQNTDIGIAVCTLPNGEQTTLQGSWDTCTYEGSLIGGFVFTLGSAETNYNGGLMMALAIYRSNVRLVNYPLYAVINETGLMSDTNTGVTVEEINTYLQYAMSALKINQSILAVDSIALVTDWTVYENGQIIFDKSTGIFHKKIAASPYHEVFRDFVPYTGADKDIDFNTQTIFFRDSTGEAGIEIYNGNLTIFTSLGDINLSPDNRLLYSGDEVATQNYVSTALTNYYVKTQIDSFLATKLDKVTDSYPYQRLYGVSTSGVQQMFAFSSSAVAYQVVQRKYDANITVPLSPSTDDNATSKSYVDSKATSVQSALQTEINKAGHYLAISGGQSTNYIYTISLKDKNSNVIDTIEFDLPLESVVVDGYYDSTNKEIVLELDNGSTVEIPVGDLISGLASQADLNALASTVTQLSNAAFKYADVIITGGYVSALKVNNVNYPVAQNVAVTTIPKVVQSVSGLPQTNDGYLYVVLDNGYLYSWQNNAWAQAYQYTSDLLTITEVTVEED